MAIFIHVGKTTKVAVTVGGKSAGHREGCASGVFESRGNATGVGEDKLRVQRRIAGSGYTRIGRSNDGHVRIIFQDSQDFGIHDVIFKMGPSKCQGSAPYSIRRSVRADVASPYRHRIAPVLIYLYVQGSVRIKSNISCVR